MSIIGTALTISIILLSVSVFLILVRFMRGPSLPDRVISLDVFSATLLGILAVYSLITDVQSYLDVAIVFSLVAFMGTVAFVYYILKRDGK